MCEMTSELAEMLGLAPHEGGWVPQEGVEVAVLVEGGVSGPVSLRPVSRMIPQGDGWILWIEEKAEKIWVRSASIVLISGKRLGLSGRDKRTGFA